MAASNSSKDPYPEEVQLAIHSAVLHSGNLYLGRDGKELLQPFVRPHGSNSFPLISVRTLQSKKMKLLFPQTASCMVS